MTKTAVKTKGTTKTKEVKQTKRALNAEELFEQVQQYENLKKQISALKKVQDVIKADLKQLMEDKKLDELEVKGVDKKTKKEIVYTLTYQEVKSMEFDEAQFKLDHKQIYAKYIYQKVSKRFNIK